jgi:hypothetical protein
MYLARSRARGMERAAMSAGDGSARLHSRPVYHGMYVALLTIVPALIVIVLWAVLEPVYLASLIRSALPSDVQALPGTEQQAQDGCDRQPGRRLEEPHVSRDRATAQQH